jgi:hypothetical protein
MTALSPLYRKLCLSPSSELERVLVSGGPPDPERIAGFEFYGFNTLPLTTLLGIRKFKKGFYRRQKGPTPFGGYNVKIKPAQLDGSWVAGGPGGAYVGYFDVSLVAGGAREQKHPNALLLDYGRDKRNSLPDGSFLRDYVVQPDPSDPDVLLGKAYAALGPARIAVSFFVLQRAHRGSQSSAFYEAA